MDVLLTIHSIDRTWAVPLSRNRLTLGRGEAADVVINDSGLSRVHASIHREGERVWIVDEGSTNGTSVNDQPVPPAGMPLNNGDEIGFGDTAIVVSLKANTPTELSDASAIRPPASNAARLPVSVIAAGVGVVVLFAVIVIAIGVTSRTRNENGGITAGRYSGSSNNVDEPPAATPNTSSAVIDERPNSNAAAPPLSDPPELGQVTTRRRYLAMSADEQRQFVAAEAQHVARMIGNREGFAFTPEVVGKIQIWVDAYARRVNSPKPSGGCNMRHDLGTLLNRARLYAPTIVRAFNEKGLSPQVGLYLAMIEAEFCPCLSSGTGPKGYFQFASSTARRYGVQDVSAPKDTRPDDRCKIEIMAPIAAQYMKDLIAMFGTGPLSVPLAVASYNEGEGGLSTNLMKALNAARSADNPERSFWTMVAHEEMMSDQFQREAIKYVPHFFGAAIVGENPRVFGVDLEPISSYTQPQGNAGADQKASE